MLGCIQSQSSELNNLTFGAETCAMKPENHGMEGVFSK